MMNQFRRVLAIASIVLSCWIGYLVYQLNTSTTEIISNGFALLFSINCLAIVVSVGFHKENSGLKTFGLALGFVLMILFSVGYSHPTTLPFLWSYLLCGIVLLIGLSLSTLFLRNKQILSVSVLSTALLSVCVLLQMSTSLLFWISIVLASIISLLALIASTKSSN